MPKNSNDRRIQGYLKPRKFILFKAYVDIEEVSESHAINQMFDFFMQQFSEHDKQLFIEHYKKIKPQ